MPYFADFASSGDGIQRIVHGDSSRISIAVRDDRMLVVLAGEPSGEDLLEALRQGLREGWLRLSMRTLVDLTQFIGVVDWSAINAVRSLADWAGDEGACSRVAYLVRNDAFGFIVKAVSGLFGHTEHRMYVDRDHAVEWLTS